MAVISRLDMHLLIVKNGRFGKNACILRNPKLPIARRAACGRRQRRSLANVASTKRRRRPKQHALRAIGGSGKHVAVEA